MTTHGVDLQVFLFVNAVSLFRTCSAFALDGILCMSSTLLSGKSVFLMQQNELIVVAIRRWLLYLNLKNHYGNIKVQTRFNVFTCFGHIYPIMPFCQPVSDVSKCNILTYAVYVSMTCRINLTLFNVSLCKQEVILTEIMSTLCCTVVHRY